MHLYKDYLKERENAEIISDEYGFAVYRFPTAEAIYLQDIFVKPVHRMSGKASEYAKIIEDIGREKGCKLIYGSVDLSANGVEQSMLAVLHYGFKFDHQSGSVLYFKKDL